MKAKDPAPQCAVQMCHSHPNTMYRAKVWKLFSFFLLRPWLASRECICWLWYCNGWGWWRDDRHSIIVERMQKKKINVKHLSFMSLQQAYRLEPLAWIGICKSKANSNNRRAHNYNEELATFSEVIVFYLGKPSSSATHAVTKGVSMNMWAGRVTGQITWQITSTGTVQWSNGIIS